MAGQNRFVQEKFGNRRQLAGQRGQLLAGQRAGHRVEPLDQRGLGLTARRSHPGVPDVRREGRRRHRLQLVEESVHRGGPRLWVSHVGPDQITGTAHRLAAEISAELSDHLGSQK